MCEYQFCIFNISEDLSMLGSLQFYFCQCVTVWGRHYTENETVKEAGRRKEENASDRKHRRSQRRFHQRS